MKLYKNYAYAKNKEGIMKKKRQALMLVVIFGILTITAANAKADWYACIIHGAGPGGDGYNYVQLSDTADPAAFTERWFVLKPQQRKELLAVTLSALGNYMNVAVLISGPPDEYSIVSGLVCMSP